jgi:signal transduction histidine kinase
VKREERFNPVSLTLVRTGLEHANPTSHLGMPVLEDGENLLATLAELTRLAFEEATQPELVRTYMDLARQQLALLGSMVRNRKESAESLPWTTVDVSALAETALQMQERALAKRGLHLVTEDTESPQTEVYMTQMLRAIWDLIGGVLETLAETPTILPELH